MAHVFIARTWLPHAKQQECSGSARSSANPKQIRITQIFLFDAQQGGTIWAIESANFLFAAHPDISQQSNSFEKKPFHWQRCVNYEWSSRFVGSDGLSWALDSSLCGRVWSMKTLWHPSQNWTWPSTPNSHSEGVNIENHEPRMILHGTKDIHSYHLWHGQPPKHRLSLAIIFWLKKTSAKRTLHIWNARCSTVTFSGFSFEK